MDHARSLVLQQSREVHTLCHNLFNFYSLKVKCDIMIEPGEEINSVFWLAVAIISIIPFYIFLLSYKKVGSRKFLFITIAFFIFIFKGFFLSMKLFFPDEIDENGWLLDDQIWWTIAAVLDVFIVCLITMALTISEGISGKNGGEQNMELEERVP